jgi:hypothetical protein
MLNKRNGVCSGLLCGGFSKLLGDQPARNEHTNYLVYCLMQGRLVLTFLKDIAYLLLLQMALNIMPYISYSFFTQL